MTPTRMGAVRSWARLRRAGALLLLGLAADRPASAAPGTDPLATLSPSTVVSKVPTLSDPGLTWELYLPRGFSTSRRWPVLLLFDPRGRGRLPLELFRDAADEFGWMLASSNDTRSDSPGTDNSRALNALLSDATRRLPVDTRRIYAGGFSGGGVLAWVMALKADWLAGVVSVGGRPAPEHASLEPRCALYAAAGTGDFNHLPTVKLDRIAAKAGVPHRLVFFQGPHAWFGKDLARDAVAWLEILAVRDGKAALPPARLDALRLAELASARALEESGDPLAAVRRLREIAVAFRGSPDAESAPARAEALEATPAARAASKAARAAEAYEEKATRLIGEATRLLRGETPPPPSSTLRRILKVEEALRLASGEGPMSSAARRVLAAIHVQLAFYQTQELFHAKDYRRALPALEVAVEAAPGDTVARYNLACAQARTGAADEALASLARALELGLSQPLQLETDPDLASLRARPGFAPLLERARALAAAPGK